MPPERATHEERGRVRGKDGEHDGDDRPEAVLGDVPDEEQEAEPGTHPDDSEERDAEGGRRGHPDVREAVEDEREKERRQDPAEHPREIPELEAEQSQHEAPIASDHERTSLPCHPVELVERERDRRRA